MRADSKFNKRAASAVASNYTSVKHAPFNEVMLPIELTVFGSGSAGDWHLWMNPLEAHRLAGQLNEALSGWAKYQIATTQPKVPS